jgi:hypothetical protein
MRGIFHVQVLFTFITFFFFFFFHLSFGLEGKKDFYALLSVFSPLSPGIASRSAVFQCHEEDGGLLGMCMRGWGGLLRRA